MKKIPLGLAGLLISISLHAQLLRVAVAGMAHDHVHGLLQQRSRGEVIIVGISEANEQLAARYRKQYSLPDSLFYPDLAALLHKVKPDIVLAYNPIADHVTTVETAAPYGISVMVEKPLATTVEQANRIAALVLKYRIQVLTNYETTWYPSTQFLREGRTRLTGDVRKMVAHDGHQGPREIGCSPDFLAWLTDPVKNGGGALTDFGCYGANLMTWIMNGQRPLAVTAVTRRIKSDIYPKVDDDATVLVEYPSATGIIEASWNWPYGIKDLEIFGTTGYLHALNSTDMQSRSKQDAPVAFKAEVKDGFSNNLSYLAAVLRGRHDPANDLSSLENNLIVVQILEAARRSAAEGKRVELK